MVIIGFLWLAQAVHGLHAGIEDGYQWFLWLSWLSMVDCTLCMIGVFTWLLVIKMAKIQ